MGQLRADLIRKLNGLAPFERIARFYERPADFDAELNNYLVGGLVISTPSMFVMAKPIDSSVDPRGQWYAEKPDCWYVKWFSGEGALRAVMDAVNPLPKVSFTRTKNGEESKLRTYRWERLYKLTGE